MTRKCLITAAIGTLLAVLSSAPAYGAIQIENFQTTSSESRAGAHPDLSMSFDLVEPGDPEAARYVRFEAPEGISGNPVGVPRCIAADFAQTQCSPNAQIGLITVRANDGVEFDHLYGTAPIYNLVPNGPNDTARFGFVVPQLNIPIHIPVEVRTGSDYGLRFTVSEISQLTPLASVETVFWGIPTASTHDVNRFPKGSPGNPSNCPESIDTGCIVGGTKSSAPVVSFINNPSECTGQPLVTRLLVESYQDPGNLSESQSSYSQTTQCQQQQFRPVLYAKPTTTVTDAPSGLDLKLTAQQPIGLVPLPSPMKAVQVSFPEGFTVNPDAADGLGDCTDAQARFGSDLPAACPDNSKVGNFNIISQALDGPLKGSAYLGRQAPGDPYRLFLIADGFGIHAKFKGSVRPNPVTGQITTHFEGLPQMPFEHFELHLFSSDRGLMATPTHCTIYTVDATFEPWNSELARQRSSQVFGLDSGPNGTFCPPQQRPFNPRLVAGSTNPTGGAFSDFKLTLERDDGDQFLDDLSFVMPPGFTGDLGGIPYCSEAGIAAAAASSGLAEIADPSCPPGGQIGTSNVAAGPGTHPFHAVGKMYLSGPLKGAPLSLVAITPALAGPYDYGNVVVRVALYVDPITAQVRAVSEPMPQVIGGIPIRMRSIRVSIDRPNFTINPTNCSQFTVDSQGVGDQGAVAKFSSPFSAVNCATLPFRPRMAIRQLGGRSQTLRSKNPRLRFDLRTRAGDANISSVSVTLPKAFAIDQRHLGNICSRAQLEAERCRGRQPIGNVWVKTPLLDERLQGPAYAVSGFGRLPRVAFILDGQVTLVPQAESSAVNGRLRTLVPIVPDAPIGHFRLTLLGSKQGYLVNTRDLCSAKAVTKVQYNAHNGRRRSQRVRVKTPCGNKRKAKRHGHRRVLD
jgi:hypothetical protein